LRSIEIDQNKALSNSALSSVIDWERSHGADAGCEVRRSSMALPFETIPTVAVEYVRSVFAAANDKATSAVSVHPSMYEETLDNILIMELSASPPAFFAAEQVGISIESHWLGARWMFGRWEIADIAVFVLLRRRAI